MKKKFLKFFMPFMLAMMFLVTLSSCGNENKYLEGEGCGNATEEGTVFSEIRKVYCERFVYEYNLALVEEGKEYASYADVYNQKYLIENGDVQLIEADNDKYTQSHYLFVYFAYETQEKAYNYINSNVTNPDKYIELMKICANGKRSADDTTYDERYGYFPKVENTKYDDDTKNSVTSVKSRLTSHSKACLVFNDNFYDPDTGVYIPKSKYKDAWSVGFLFGLFVYPMAWLISLFVNLFGGTTSGWGQAGAIIVVTFILKILILLLTFKSQAGTQKMQDIQPEILKIQSKYGPTPSPADKQKMSMEMMAVYQKYGVKPLAPLASLFITFPVFIAMYRAVMYLAILRTGKIGGVILGNVLSTYIIGENAFNFVALIIFVIMAASQILTMKLPQILNRKRMSTEAKKQQKQAGMMTNVMMIMILVMGFFMPITMSIYWIASAIVGAVQSVIMHKLNNGNKNGKYKVKKAESEPAKIPQGYKK